MGRCARGRAQIPDYDERPNHTSTAAHISGNTMHLHGKSYNPLTLKPVFAALWIGARDLFRFPDLSPQPAAHKPSRIPAFCSSQ